MGSLGAYGGVFLVERRLPGWLCFCGAGFLVICLVLAGGWLNTLLGPEGSAARESVVVLLVLPSSERMGAVWCEPGGGV